MQVLRQSAAIVLTLASALAAGWVAFQLQEQETLPRFFFPLIFPLLVGAVVGGLSAAVFRWLATATRYWPFAAAGLAGLTVVLSQSWFSYRYYTADRERQIAGNPLATMAAQHADGFGHVPMHRFIAAQIDRSGGWWLADAGLTVAASILSGWLWTSSFHLKTEV